MNLFELIEQKQISLKHLIRKDTESTTFTSNTVYGLDYVIEGKKAYLLAGKKGILMVDKKKLYELGQELMEIGETWGDIRT